MKTLITVSTLTGKGKAYGKEVVNRPRKILPNLK
jgi:hypothetical protein